MAILFCWEFGGGWGHLFRLRALAVEFAAKPLVFAVPDLEKAGQCLPRDAQIVKAPAVSPSGPQLTFSRNFADSLYQAGLFDSDQLSQCLTEWIELLESLQVDSLVAECAPTAVLAARILGMPAVATGTGFTLPPMRTPFPSHHPWLDLPRGVLLKSEDRLLSIVLWSYRLVARELCVGVSLWSRNPDLGARIRQVRSFTPAEVPGTLAL